MFFHAVAPFVRDAPLILGALVERVPFRNALFPPVSPEFVGMNVSAPVDLGPPPGCVVNDHHVCTPVEATVAPAHG